MALKEIRIVDTNRPKSIPKSLQQIIKPTRTCKVISSVENPKHLRAVSNKPAHIKSNPPNQQETPRVWSDGTTKLLIVMEAGEALLVTQEKEFKTGNLANLNVISKVAFFSKFKAV
jgi:hypothetical protein